jgi:hypothetical protein
MRIWRVSRVPDLGQTVGEEGSDGLERRAALRVQPPSLRGIRYPAVPRTPEAVSAM